MKEIKFYKRLPDMECLAGDTLPDLTVSVEADSLEGCRMQLIAAKSDSPGNAVICKECTPITGGFTVQLTSADTSELTQGTYNIHFRFIGANSLDYRKLCGLLYVRAAAKGV